MKSNDEKNSFRNTEEAELLLKKSRKRIDEIDNALFDLISERTSLARDIVSSKNYLQIPIFDQSRENAIHSKVKGMAEERGLDVDIIDQIVDMLTILSKNEQKKILREEC